MDNRIKDPLAAIILSMALPGLGHIYAAKIKKGIIFFLIITVLSLGLIVWLLHPAMKINPFFLVLAVILVVLVISCLIDSYNAANKNNAANKLQRSMTPRKRILLFAGMSGVLLVYCFAVWLVWSNLYRSFTAPADSMEPTIYKGERVFVDLRAYKKSGPQRADVVLYRYPQEPRKIYMHRVVGLPGESVELKNHRILINKVQLEDDWAIKIRHYNRGKFAQKGSPSVIVPQDSYYILGDNSARSQDSRFWGCLARSDLIGKVFKRYFPFHRSGTIE